MIEIDIIGDNYIKWWIWFWVIFKKVNKSSNVKRRQNVLREGLLHRLVSIRLSQERNSLNQGIKQNLNLKDCTRQWNIQRTQVKQTSSQNDVTRQRQKVLLRQQKIKHRFLKRITRRNKLNTSQKKITIKQLTIIEHSRTGWAHQASHSHQKKTHRILRQQKVWWSRQGMFC